MEIKAGDIVEYNSCNGVKIVKVISVCNDNRNGAPGFIGEQLSPGFYGVQVWCYIHQIVRLV